MFRPHTLVRRIGAKLSTAALILVGCSAAVAGETITYFHNDILGSPIVATDSNGLVTWKAHYRPYGDRVIDAPEITSNALWFSGKPYDRTTGLMYMGARYYSPVIGRFTGMDPVQVDLENLHGVNRFAYANNNPYKFVDPDGRIAFLAIVVIAVKVIDVAITAYDLHTAAKHGGAGGLAKAAGANAAAGLVPGGKIAGKLGGAAIRFAQRGVSSTFRHGEFAGRSIGDVAAGLRSGDISPDQLPIQTVTRDGVTYTLNNRSLMALREAGLEPTNVQDVTGDEFFEQQLTERLEELGDKLDENFVPKVRK